MKRYEVINDPDQPDTVPRFIIRDREGVMSHAERFCGSFHDVKQARKICVVLNQAEHKDAKDRIRASVVDRNETYDKQERKHRKKIKKLKRRLTESRELCLKQSGRVGSVTAERDSLNQGMNQFRKQIDATEQQNIELTRKINNDREHIAQLEALIEERGIVDHDKQSTVIESLRLENKVFTTRDFNHNRNAQRLQDTIDGIYDLVLEQCSLLEIQTDE